jgi:hypothetical protein
LLADLPLDVLAAAALQCIATVRFFPTIAELREAAALLTEPERQSGMEVWGEAIDELSKAKAEARIPRLADPIAARILKAMGGHAALSNSKDPSYDRSQFVKAYEAAVERERQKARVLPQARALLAQADRPRTALDSSSEPFGFGLRPASAVAPVVGVRCLQCGNTVEMKPSQYRADLRSTCCGMEVEVTR